ncbi:MAG: PD-(D/E)XK motif protein [Myxococcales bacterium]
MAALVAYEMQRRGLGQPGIEAQKVFSEVEPIVELALRRAQLSDEAVLGLTGELLLLDELLAAMEDRPEGRSAILDAWRGHQRAARDFTLGCHAIEVKTTTFLSSIHHINGLAQIEPQTAAQSEAALLLFSVGLTKAENGPFSVAKLVERILGKLAGSVPEGVSSPLQLLFLEKVRGYGGEQGEGYDHATMRGFPGYQQTFTTTFEPRLYDACDPAFKVLRSAHLEGTFVSHEEISFKIVLPERIHDLNPRPNWRTEARQLARQLAPGDGAP